MWLTPSLRCLKSARRRGQRGHGRRPEQQRLRCVPWLENLEDRTVPSTFTVCTIMGVATPSGAQTERRGGAGPVGGLLGGKDPTGRFLLFSFAFAHSGWLIPDASVRLKPGRSFSFVLESQSWPSPWKPSMRTAF